jgi:hypothetical protein
MPPPQADSLLARARRLLVLLTSEEIAQGIGQFGVMFSQGPPVGNETGLGGQRITEDAAPAAVCWSC